MCYFAQHIVIFGIIATGAGPVQCFLRQSDWPLRRPFGLYLGLSFTHRRIDQADKRPRRVGINIGMRFPQLIDRQLETPLAAQSAYTGTFERGGDHRRKVIHGRLHILF